MMIEDIKYIGVNDYEIDLFEGLYEVPHGMSYNSYVVFDEKIVVFDTVDSCFGKEWLRNMKQVLDGKKPQYLIVQHMEPDHSANIFLFLEKYPEAVVIASKKAFEMMHQFFGKVPEKTMVVTDGDTLITGKHEFLFFTAPMVHWPEVIMTYDKMDKVLFSADAFGKFGAIREDDDWKNEARRYYIGIVGKYGFYVQKLFQKLEGEQIALICPLHGPMLSEDISYYVGLYQIWSGYQAEEDGVVIAYCSIYGNTKKAALLLRDILMAKSYGEIKIYDLCRCDKTWAVADAFRFSKLVLASPMYNAGIFPPMREFISMLTERNFKNRKVAMIENGSWAIVAAKIMKEKFDRSENIEFVEPVVRIVSALNEESFMQLNQLADALCK